MEGDKGREGHYSLGREGMRREGKVGPGGG